MAGRNRYRDILDDSLAMVEQARAIRASLERIERERQERALAAGSRRLAEQTMPTASEIDELLERFGMN